jgi:hypothetical protein
MHISRQCPNAISKNDHLHMKSVMSKCQGILSGEAAIYVEDKDASVDSRLRWIDVVRHYSFFQIVAFALAVNYFSYQVEFDEKEYLENHRQLSDTLSFARPSVNWETFDKSNAPKAFVVEVIDKVSLLIVLPPEISEDDEFYLQYTTIRDKSPPTCL